MVDTSITFCLIYPNVSEVISPKNASFWKRCQVGVVKQPFKICRNSSRGVCKCFTKCTPVGCVPSWGMSAWGEGCLPAHGECLPRGCLPKGECLPRRGVCLLGGVPGQEGVYTSPMDTCLTHACENITFPQLRLRRVKMVTYPLITNIFLWILKRTWECCVWNWFVSNLILPDTVFGAGGDTNKQ